MVDEQRTPGILNDPVLVKQSERGTSEISPLLIDAPSIASRENPTWYPVVIFCLAAALLFADQNLMAPNLTDIAASFEFNEHQRDTYLGGFIGAAFYSVGAPAALLFGYLSHFMSRRLLFLIAVVVGEGPCLLTVFVTKYWQLFLLRVLTGISIGGCLPLIFSLLSDMYVQEHRSLVSAVVQVAVGVGIAMGQGVAGYIGPTMGWRWPFVLVAFPAIICAILMYATTEEPERGAREKALQLENKRMNHMEYQAVLDVTKIKRLFTIRTNLYAIGQGLFGCLPWGMLLTFLNDYLAQEKSLSIPSSTSIVLGIGIGGAIGVLGGGALGQYIYNRTPRHMPVFIGLSTIAGAFPMWYIVKGDVKGHYSFSIFCSMLAGMLSSTVGPNVRAMIMNVNEPETRGVALALQTTLDDLGKGLGPAIVASMISGLGREAAFSWATAGWVPCGAMLMLICYTLEDDEKAMQERLRQNMAFEKQYFDRI
jgi:predicted MFS family arabinose efflux permease